MKQSRLRVPPLVQVMTDLRLEYFREIALGARQYGFETGRLRFDEHWLPYEQMDGLAALVKKRGIEGLILPLHRPADYARARRLPTRVVNVSNSRGAHTLPLVTQDDLAIGRLAAEHLMECGCRAFGFWGVEGQPFSQDRQRGFCGRLDASGMRASAACARGESPRWIGKMRAWLAALPRPVGIFAVNDVLAMTLMRLARGEGLRVPEDVAVLGCGNEPYWVDFERTPLSSIQFSPRAVGYEAAALLDRMLSGGLRAEDIPCIRLPVGQVVRRESTDVMFVEDETIRRALAFIRAHAHENPYVSQVARGAGVSVTAIKARFRKKLGRSVLQEILRARVDLARRLLAQTKLPMSAIAERCGFPNSQRFSLRFRQSTGQTPTACRRQLLRCASPNTPLRESDRG